MTEPNDSNQSLSDCRRGSRSASRRQRQFLFEVGGNIGELNSSADNINVLLRLKPLIDWFSAGERCLDPDAHLMDVYRTNPHCEWVLKSRLTWDQPDTRVFTAETVSCWRRSRVKRWRWPLWRASMLVIEFAWCQNCDRPGVCGSMFHHTTRECKKEHVHKVFIPLIYPAVW